MKLEGKAKMLRIHFGEDDKWEDKPLYRAIVEKLLNLGIAGATVFKGTEGFGSSAHIHSARILEITENLPVLIEVVDTPKQILKALNAAELIRSRCSHEAR